MLSHHRQREKRQLDRDRTKEVLQTKKLTPLERLKLKTQAALHNTRLGVVIVKWFHFSKIIEELSLWILGGVVTIVMINTVTVFLLYHPDKKGKEKEKKRLLTDAHGAIERQQAYLVGLFFWLWGTVIKLEDKQSS